LLSEFTIVSLFTAAAYSEYYIIKRRLRLVKKIYNAIYKKDSGFYPHPLFPFFMIV